MSQNNNTAVEANMYFLSRDEKYREEKPYTLRYSTDDGFPQTNIERTEYSIKFYDMRTQADLVYSRCGFQVANLHSQMRYEDYDDVKKIESIHQPEVAECVKQAMKASSAEILDYVVRRRHPTWPIATGESYDFQQPASRAHIGDFSPYIIALSSDFLDHTYEAGCKIIRDIYGRKANAILGGRWQCVNVWHPLRGPLVDWPLAICDAETVDFENDIMAGDVVDRDAVFENTQVHYNPQQKWYYLANQMPSELLIFKNADSESKFGASPGVPHASFDNPLTKDSDIRRESIEFRVLVLW